MKMTPEHYATLKLLFAQIAPIRTNTISEIEEAYISSHAKGSLKAKDIHMRLRWDLFSCIHTESKIALLDELYTYLHDSHIDTAIKKIVKELYNIRPIIVKHTFDEPGFCREYYKSVKGVLYCLQEESPTLKLWYVCSQDGEPLGCVDLKSYEMFVVNEFKFPTKQKVS